MDATRRPTMGPTGIVSLDLQVTRHRAKLCHQAPQWRAEYAFMKQGGSLMRSRTAVPVAAAVLVLAGCTAPPPLIDRSPPPDLQTPDPAPVAFGCRSVTKREMQLARMESRVLTDRPSATVDLDATWRLVGYWHDIGRAEDGSRMVFTQVIVTNGKRFNYVGLNWNGKYQAAGVELVDGPAANHAVRACIGDPEVQ